MAAGLGFKDFVTGEVLTAADVDGYLMQGIWVFASAAARDAAVTSPQEGNACYLKDTNQVLTYSGSAWVAVGGSASPLTTKGDVYGFSTTDARIPIGANDTVLTADSTQALGLKWAAAASGGGMTLISETVASASTGISFTSIPGTYKQLLLVFNGLYHSGVGSQFNPRFNASAVSEYITQGMKNGGTTNATDTTGIRPPEPLFGEDATSSTNYNTINGYLLVDNYASTTKFKYFQCGSAYLGSSFFFLQGYGFWENTSAITSIDITRVSGSATISNITNTTLRLYGIS